MTTLACNKIGSHPGYNLEVSLEPPVVQVHGTKLWTMLPPPHAVYSRRHASVDAVQVPIEAAARNQSGSVLRCVQHPGDLIYVPDGWCVCATGIATPLVTCWILVTKRNFG